MNAMLDSFDEINKAVAQPIYQQIKTHIEQKIAAGDWVAGKNCHRKMTW